MSRAGVRSSDSTCGKRPGEADDRTAQSTKETSAGTKNWTIAMPTSLWAIADKAREDKQHRFGGLARLLTQDNLKRCFGQLKKKAAPGVDRVTWHAYGADLEGNTGELERRLKANRYRARLVRRKYIPKLNGKRRPLGILVIEDKVVQRACAQILDAIYEEDFLECSYAYRTRRGVKDAVREVTRSLQFGKYRWVVEADIKGFYDNIDHEKLMAMLKQRINDGRLLRLIRKWLKAGILEEEGQVIDPVTGTPQGGLISPVLANVYLHQVLDQWFEQEIRAQSRGAAMMNRYADDFICAFHDKEDAQRFIKRLRERLAEYGLELATDKTRMLRFSRFELKDNESFDYLGFEFRWGRALNGKAVVKRRTSRKKLRASVANFTQWIKEHRHQGIGWIMGRIVSKLRGYWNHYGVIGNQESQWQFYNSATRILYKWLNRRSQRGSYTWAGLTGLFKRYGVPQPRITEVVPVKVAQECLWIP
jgi:RNA-directed DNA polymerase